MPSATATHAVAEPGGAPPGPDHAFSGEFLDLLLEEDQPSTAPAAAAAGPWEVDEVRGRGWLVRRLGEAGAEGEPAAVLDERQDALLLAAVLPASARRGDTGLAPERGPQGYDLVRAGGRVGRLAWFDSRLAELHAALRALVADPRSLALLLEAAGHDALDRAGRLLARRARGPRG